MDIQQTLGDNALPHCTIAYWVTEFKRGRSSCEDDPRSGRPSTSIAEENIKKIKKCQKEEEEEP